MATIPVGSGLASQLVVKDEATYGVAPSLASGIDSFEFENETLELKKTAVQGEGLAAGHVYQRTKRRVLTNYDANGAVSMNLPTRGMHFWLRHMVGDFSETITQILTSGIYRAVYQPKSGLAGHSFALQKGVPAVDNASVKPHTYVGCKIPSWEISISTGGIAQLTLNIDARNELGGAGNSDPLNPSVPALATWALPSTGLGTSVFHFREATLFSGGTPTLDATPVAPVPTTLTTGGTVLAGTYQVTVTYVFPNGESATSPAGQVVTTGSTSTITIPSPSASPGATGWYAYVSQAGGAAATATRQQASGSPTNIGTNLTLTAPPTSSGALGPVGSPVSLAGATELGNVKAATIQHAIAFDTNRVFLGGNGFKSEQIENGYRAITGSLQAEFLSSEALYNAYSADTTTSLQLTFTGPTVSGQTYLFDVIIPNIKLDGESPKVSGPDIVPLQVNFTGSDDETTVPIQITYQSEDTVV